MPAPTLPDVSSKYGAPMGRRSSHPGNEPEHRLYLNHVPLDSGGYDSGGAYWGFGRRLYHATGGQDFELFLRARDRKAAKAHLVDLHPNATFYR
jgi:hypothetical protein